MTCDKRTPVRSLSETEQGGNVEDLARLVAALVLAELRDAPARLVDAEVIGQQLAVPASWVLAEARAQRIPHTRLGRYVRFDPAEVDAWWRRRVLGPWRQTEPGTEPRGGTVALLRSSTGGDVAEATGAHPVTRLEEAA